MTVTKTKLEILKPRALVLRFKIPQNLAQHSMYIIIIMCPSNVPTV